ncbi:MAG: DUF975 family protein [Lentisphaeria bacterium]|nr:DUF975 family protein [Lentisphaeria bacterium]
MFLFAKDFRAMARERLRGFWAISVAVALVALLLGGSIASSSVSFEINVEESVEQQLPSNPTLEETLAYIDYVLELMMPLIIASGIYGVFVFIVGGAVKVGYCRFLIDQFDRKEPKFAVLFSKFNRFGKCLLLNFLTGLFTFLWSLLLIVPGIIAAYRYAMAPFILAEHPEMTPMECLRASKEMMMGNKSRLFCLECSFIGWMVLGALTYGIGSLIVAPYMAAAKAAFYRTLNPAPGSSGDVDGEKAGFDPMNIMADHMMAEEVCQEEIQSQEHIGGNFGGFGG